MPQKFLPRRICGHSQLSVVSIGRMFAARTTLQRIPPFACTAKIRNTGNTRACLTPIVSYLQLNCKPFVIFKKKTTKFGPNLMKFKLN